MNTPTPTASWLEENQRYLMASLAQVRQRLETHLNLVEKVAEGQTTARGPNVSPPPALETLCRLCHLSPFERDLLLLCAGLELDAAFANLFAQLQGDPQKAYPTISMALSVLPNAHWSALTPTAPLRRWRLIEVGPGRALTLSPLRIDERILHYLTGVQALDERLISLVNPITPLQSELVSSHAALAEQIATTWEQLTPNVLIPVIQICGYEATDRSAIATAACQRLNLNLHRIAASTLPTAHADLHSFIQLWEREAMLSRSALLLDWDLVYSNGDKEGAIAHLIETLKSPLILSCTDRQPARQRPLITFDVAPPTAVEQRQLWQSVLGPSATNLNGHVEHLVSQFNFSSGKIQSAYTRARGQLSPHEAAPEPLFRALWQACCIQSRPRLEDLAQRIPAASIWADLVLPDMQRQILHDVAAHVRQRAKVYTQWGFAAKSHRGLGISALFAGASGTGKTTAAEVIAGELNLDLYRIDLSAVVSKYIGETEKNLRRIFDAAEAGGVILLFDEADALFGKRSDVKDSHDRYANMEVSYLLQRIEAYQGLAILTTNLKTSIDTAFLRRLRFVVQFPFPDVVQRTEIWRRMFPANTPTQDLDFRKLAKLSVAGGNIRNIALNAAFIAADANEPVQMKHLLQAAQSEYLKLERPLTDAEIKGWV
ncbi:MAG TPA: AAA family ATPase [Leptolyngbyaceae cyanobacterium]